MPVSVDDILAQLQWRYATKKFDPNRKISADLWAKLEETLLLSPSSYGLQPWKFIVVTDPATRAKLSPAAYNQAQITSASHLVVFAMKKGMGVTDADRHLDRIAEVRSVPPASLDGLRKTLHGTFGSKSAEQIDVWMARQVMIPLGVFLASAAILGVDACPMEGFVPDQFDEILGLKAKGYGSVVLAAAGYRSSEDPYATAKKVRFPKEHVIEHI